MRRMQLRWPASILALLPSLTGCATDMGGRPHLVDVITPESAALLMPILQETAVGKLDMNTFHYRQYGPIGESAWLQTERVKQSDGAEKWRSVYCSATILGWQCKADIHRTLRVDIGGEKKPADISIDADVDAGLARAALMGAIRELGRWKPIAPCRGDEPAVSGLVLLEEITQTGEGRLRLQGGEFTPERFATVHFEFEASRDPQVQLRCLTLGDVLEE